MHSEARQLQLWELSERIVVLKMGKCSEADEMLGGVVSQKRLKCYLTQRPDDQVEHPKMCADV